MYSKSEQKKTLLLMHILIIGLILQQYQMGARACDLLRQTVKISPVQFSSLYRYASYDDSRPSATALRHPPFKMEPHAYCLQSFVALQVGFGSICATSLVRRGVVLAVEQSYWYCCREMGCIVRSNAPKGGASVGSASRDLSVLLLPASATAQLPPKKLSDYFPVIKLGNKRSRN